MSDPITCPQCEGRRWEPFGPLRIECAFCHGRGVVGGPDDPEENPPQPPDAPPPAWKHKVWRDPFMSSAFPCRLCFGSRKVVHVDAEAGTVVQVPCVCLPDGAA